MGVRSMSDLAPDTIGRMHTDDALAAWAESLARNCRAGLAMVATDYDRAFLTGRAERAEQVAQSLRKAAQQRRGGA